MTIQICENLKHLRKTKNVTQEALADHLGISIQAVSKWERDEGYPDITLLPKIAMFYNTTVDNLLGVGEMQVESKIAEYWQESDTLQRTAEFDKNLVLWEEATREFPNNHSVMHGYMTALMLKNGICQNPTEYADEIIKVGERLFAESTEVQHKYEVIWNLTRLYSQLGNEEKAMEYATQAPILDITVANLLTHVLKGEKAVAHVQEVLKDFAYLMYNQVEVLVREGNFSNAERRKAHIYSINFFNLLYEDGDYGFICTRIADIYSDIAMCDAIDGNKEEALKHITLAVDCVIKFLTQRGFKHTSFMVNRLEHPDGHTGYPNGVENDARVLLNKLQNENFDFCRQEEAFKAAEARLLLHAN